VFWSALFSEQLALGRLQDSLEHFSALSRLGIGNSRAGNWKALFRIPFRKLLADLQSRLRDESKAAPLEVWAELKDLGHHLEGRGVSLPGNNALVLIFDASLSGMKLAQQHNDGLQQVERLESRRSLRAIHS